jgi:DNA polymerase III epsilon subunit-like protein
MGVVFLDTETTGLDPDRHEIWELAFILGIGQEYEFRFRPDLAVADPMALRIGRFYERSPRSSDPFTKDERGYWSDPRQAASTVAQRLDGQHLVGAAPSFDAAFLGPWLRRHGQAATWHYHLVDVEALAAGKLGWGPPWNSDELSKAIGVDPSLFDRHTALGDARWAKAVYEAVVPDEDDR